jgi:hypothetical protein
LLSPSVAPNPWLLLADRLSAPPVDVFGLLGYTPNAKQSEFHEATEYDVLYGGARGGGKALDARTPIPTLTGWTTMGEVDVGDLVFDADGIPTTVLACSPLMLGHECYRVTFSDGSVIDADAEHLWWTFTIAERAAQATPLGSVRTTAEIRATVGCNIPPQFVDAQRYILSVEQILSVPVRCITVDSPGHLYLAGRSMIPTHNSYSLTVEAIKQAIKVPGLRCAVFRRSYPELYESILSNALVKLDFARALGARWNADAKVLTFPNQSSIRFRYAETLPDASHYQGGEYGLLCLDERAQFAPGVVEVLREGLRSGDGGRSVVGIRSTCNPGGASHTVVKTDYIEATDHGKNVVLDEQGRTIRFIPATVWDNIEHVSQAYVAELMSIKDPARRRAMLDGDFSAFGGQVFEEFSYDRHVVPRPTEALPKSWERWCGIDYGRRDPWAVLWMAIDNDHRVWLYRELYQTGVGVREQARRIMAIEAEAGELAVRHAIDPSTDNHLTDGLSIYEEYAQEGLGCLKADNDRIGGWQLVHDVLADGPLCRWHEHQKEQGRWHQDTCPMLHVFDGTCPNLVRTLPDLPYDKTKIEDVDTKVEDHAADALRYALKSMFGVGGPVIYDDEDRPVRAYKVLEMVPGAGTAHSPFVTNGNGNGNGSSNGH